MASAPLLCSGLHFARHKTRRKHLILCCHVSHFGATYLDTSSSNGTTQFRGLTLVTTIRSVSLCLERYHQGVHKILTQMMLSTVYIQQDGRTRGARIQPPPFGFDVNSTHCRRHGQLPSLHKIVILYDTQLFHLRLYFKRDSF